MASEGRAKPESVRPADRKKYLTRRTRSEFFDQAAEYTPVLAVRTKGGAEFFVATADRVVGRTLFGRRHRGELDTLTTAVRVVRRLGKTKASLARATFLDVGANIGTSTIPALLEHGMGSAVACEPDPENHRLLRLNLLANGLEQRALTLPLAVADKPGKAALGRSPDNWGDHRVLTSEAQKKRAKAKGLLIGVEQTTVDALVERGIVDPDRLGMVWIDAQGHEGHILGGASSVLERDTPVVFEFYPKLLATSAPGRRLQALIKETQKRIIDLRASTSTSFKELPASAIDDLWEAYADSGKLTDLLLVGPSPSKADKRAARKT
jgi:FkbM family methyltransferase